MDILNAKGNPLRLSASAVETFKDCKRKWAYAYILRMEQPRSPAAEIGNKVHDVLENYLKTGEKPEEENNRYWRIAEPGLQFLPEVESTGVTGSWCVEEWVKCQCGPLPFVGKVDLYNLEDFDNIQIDDHKTTGDGSWRWAKSPKQLAEHVQPNAYAWALVKMHNLPIPEYVDFRHIYYCTKGTPNSMEVRAKNVPWSQIEETWRKLELISEQMAVLATTKDTPEEIEATVTSCKKYGGCPYAEVCEASPLNRNKIEIEDVQIKGDPVMNERIKALREQLLNSQAAPPVVTRSAPPVIKDPQGDVAGLADKLVKALEGGNTIPIAAAEAMAKSAGVYLYEAMEIASLMNVNSFLVPKELSMTEADEATAVARKVLNQTNETSQVLTQWHEYLLNNGNKMHRKDAQAIVRDVTGAQRVRRERILDYIEQFNESQDSEVLRLQGNVILLRSGNEQEDEIEEPKKELKKHFGLMVDKDFKGNAVETYKEYAPEAADMVKAIEEVEESITQSSDTSPTLDSKALNFPKPEDTPLGRIVKELATPTIYIDCIPEDAAGVYSFTDFVREFEMQVEKEGGKVNDKFTQPLPYYGLLDYGQGPKRVAGKVLAALHRDGPQLFRGDMYVDGKHPLADEIIPILRRLKGVRVVRASR
jgi:hypothetical protein